MLELCVAAVGVHRGALTAAYVAQYAMTQTRLGKFPTAVEYAEDWSLKERSAWRHRSMIQAALGEVWPDVVAQVARNIEHAQDGLTVAAAIRTPVPAKLVGAAA